MTAVPVSIIVVSRGRPALLQRCLTAIGQLFYPDFEVVVVADPAGADAVRKAGLAGRLKLVEYDEPNIAVARNLGVMAAAGSIVAFIDDDAVPEPSWLDHLVGPFADPAVVAAGGYVRGRNGISYQFRAAFVSPTGQDIPITTKFTDPFTPDPPPGHGVKTMGTNCAFRRENVALMGGFDPVFRFFHDETDLNVRLAGTGAKTAVVPLAQVHHGFAASARRRDNRAPVSLEDVGASTILFLRKHAKEAAWAPACEALISEQRARLESLVTAGRLKRREVAPLLDGLQAGIDRGRVAPLAPLAPLGQPAQPLLRFARPSVRRQSLRLAARAWNRTRPERKARALVGAGHVVTLIRLSPTTLFHRVRFVRDGYWLHTGGIFGRALRDEPVFQAGTFRARVEREWQRVAMLRQNRGFAADSGDAGKKTY